MAHKTLEIRVDEQILRDAKTIYEKIGLDVDDAIKLFLKQSILFNGLPLSLRLAPAEQNREPPLPPLEPKNEPAAAKKADDDPAPPSREASLASSATGNAVATSGNAAPAKADDEPAPPQPGEEPPLTDSADALAESAIQSQSDQEKKPLSIVDDEEENAESPKHLFDGWKKAPSDGEPPRTRD